MTGPPSPAEIFGPLFAEVQDRGIFADSKLFADAVPRCSPSRILADWQAAGELTDQGVREFVRARFDLPQPEAAHAPDGLPLERHLTGLWPALTRTSGSAADSSEIPLPRRFVVPGGRFRELYYWDSYFTMLGLARSDRHDLIDDMIGNFGDLLERFGRIPNGARAYYLSRSQPPVFYLMAGLSRDQSVAARRRRLTWMRLEHAFWMDGETELRPGGQARRVVMLPDGTVLNRYWDDCDAPRDESWREDRALARRTAARPARELWRELRAGAESGWDFSSRWFVDGSSLASIRTTRIIPIDLNCLLFGLESTIAREAESLGEADLSTRFVQRADRRRTAVDAHLWNDRLGHYADRDIDLGAGTRDLTAAAAFPLFTGLADHARAARSAGALRTLLRPGGLVTTARRTGEQWDAPNGWGPLQWIAVAGLRRYGEFALAETIARRWLAIVTGQYRATGQLHEKYDVENLEIGRGGEYSPETGFGWTNGVTLELMAMFGREDGAETINHHAETTT
jgi:alpha,alpha-trehalase